MSSIRLIVQADDLGMCRAVNEGIEHAVIDGIVTQTSVMAPTPWFVEGAAMARRVGVATGLHATFTCEWDQMRWAPLSTGSTLRTRDGTMHRTVDAAAELVDPVEALDELRVQARRALDAGLDLAYVDPHMGISVTTAYAQMCAELDVRFIYRGVDPHHSFDTIHWLSTSSAGDLEARTGRFVEFPNASAMACTSSSRIPVSPPPNCVPCVLPTRTTPCGQRPGGSPISRRSPITTSVP